MLKVYKTLHFVGLAAGLGGILAFLANHGDRAQAYGPLIIAGFIMSGLSGAAMMVRARLSPIRKKWLLAHLVTAGSGVFLALLVATPAGQALSDTQVLICAYVGASLLVLTMAVAVAKPRFGKIRSTTIKGE